MKHLAIFIVFFLALLQQATGQKFGYVDTNYILGKMPEFSQAKQDLEKLSKDWQSEILDMRMEIESMKTALKAEEVLLTADMTTQRKEEIRKKEEEAMAHQQKIFGYDGLYFLKKKELIKPVQDQVFDAVERVAKKKRLQIVFDKSGDLVMIYTDPIHDYTDFVLEELGLGDPNDVIE
ncbi:OmpH family outer membrane protein [Xanthovirga aplysinae]|uniref:OmpH family outer membrane protein n=1 Tax=Xanthovirga aplysinae TaxID=2529853 RepID=UPI0012BC15D0|nr:OmpH family outer membrane protein [Xanthovirga aplysinae]MTI31652.1 OmpH family outer membrane protein [Xanthovirga aplysinae]